MGLYGAGPASNEPYRVEMYDVHNPPENFHQMRKVIISSWGHNWQREQVQSIIWNLSARRHVRDFPRIQREILFSAGMIGKDDLDVLGIEELMFGITSYLFDEIIINSLENYNVTETAILNRKSRYTLTIPDDLQSCLGSFIVKPLKSDGFKRVRLSVYNTTDREQVFKLTDYYLRSMRNDVQSLAIELSRSFCSAYQQYH